MNILAYKHKMCVACGVNMEGICSYTVREVCQPCGGFSLVAYDPEALSNTMTKIQGGITARG